ncbi:hypothetical protein Q4519_06965 [Motilimonas sp. 1_MG-2023]|uniref:BRCT domain-containing protein n=1 Tax=Motilimonas sp. 1_MG-2023 TaxID=3062672 RepID=UPI0026E16C4F|nr:BRCT domain-containing protein [Motilimonas sp. 1_MG-2023]MDO6525422.1 hypothetical protein [Motilimonas sp. 1_MG-2023]
MNALRIILAIFVWMNTAFFALATPFVIWFSFSGKTETITGLIIAALCVGIAYASFRLGLWIYPATNTVQTEALDNQKNSHAESVNTNSILSTLKEMAEQVLADDVVHQNEAELLLAYLESQSLVSLGPVVRELYQALTFSLDDGHLDQTEAADIKSLLSELCDRPTPKSVNAATKPKAQPVAPKPNTSHSAPILVPKSVVPKSQPAKTSQPPLSPGVLLGFSYEDSSGNLSDRIVEFRSVSKNKGQTYLKSICTDRRAPRTFRIDRINTLFLPETGELIDDHEAYFVSATIPESKPKLARPKQSRVDSVTKNKKPEIFFSGLWREDREYYEDMAQIFGFKVVKSMTKNVAYLCCGVNAGPKKIEEANARGITIMDTSEFDTMINNLAAELEQIDKAEARA